MQSSGDAESYRGARPLPVVQALRGLHFTTASTQFNTMLAVDNCRTLLLYRERDVPCGVDRLHLRQDQVRTLIYYPPILIALLMILPGLKTRNP